MSVCVFPLGYVLKIGVGVCVGFGGIWLRDWPVSGV